MLQAPISALLLAAPLLQAGSQSPTASVTRQVQGSVTHDGKPVPGAEVHLLFRKYPLPGGKSDFANQLVHRRSRTDARGGFRLEAPAWRLLGLYATHGKLASSIRDDLRAPVEGLALELRPAWTVTGRLIHRGRPVKEEIPFRLVRTTSTETAIPLRFEGVTGANGELRVGGVPPGPWRLMLGARNWRLERPLVLRNADPSRDPQPIPLARAIRLEGQLLSSTGEKLPLPDARIEVLDVSQFYATRTDAAGGFVLAGLQSGPGTVLLVDGYGLRKGVFGTRPGLMPRSPAPQIQLRPARGWSMFGRVVDPSGNAVAGLEMLFKGRIHSTGIPVEDVSIAVKTDKDGLFGTEGVDPRAVYELMAVLPGGECQKFRGLVPKGPREDLGTLHLGQRRARARLSIEAGLTDPTLEVRIYGSKETGRFLDYEPLLRDSDSTWISPAMAGGHYCIVALSKKFGIARAELEIQIADQSKSFFDAELELRKFMRFHGKVHAGGKPRAGYQVSLVVAGTMGEGGTTSWTDTIAMQLIEELWPVEKYPRSVLSDAKGNYELWCFEASGSYDLIAQPGSTGPVDPANPTGLTRVSACTRGKQEVDIEVSR